MVKKYMRLFFPLAVMIFLLLAGCTQENAGDKNNNNKPPASKPVQKEITLYFSDSEATGLIGEKRMVEVKDSAQLPEIIVKELIAGPKDNSLQPTFPAETRLLSVTVEDKTASVDFSQDLIDKHWGGSTGETLTIMSLVNSLTELSDIEQVQIMIEGEKVETLKGHWDISEPISRDPNIILDQNTDK